MFKLIDQTLHQFANLLPNWTLRELSGKFEDTVNTEAKTSNNMELFLFVLLSTI